MSRVIRSVYDTIKEHVEKQLRRNSYSMVNFDKMFSKAFSKGGFQMRLEEEWSDIDDDEDDGLDKYYTISNPYPSQSVSVFYNFNSM